MTRLELDIDKVNNEPKKRGHVGQHPVLHQDDSLELLMGRDWGTTASITAINFYENKTDYDDPNRRPVATWTPGVTSIAGKFQIAQSPATGPVTAVALTDKETRTQEDLWYIVTIGGKDLDPEVVNKGGNATAVDPTGWVDDT